MEIRALGPLEVVHRGTPVDIGPPKQRLVLVSLLAAPGMARSVDQLVDDLWPDRTPRDPRASLYAYISRLRRLLSPPSADTPSAEDAPSPVTVIERHAAGYRLQAPADDVDLLRFEREARLGLDPEIAPKIACEYMQTALDRWRGEPFEDAAGAPFASAAANRLLGLRREAEERLLELLAITGQTVRAVAVAEEMVSRAELDEQAHAHLMLALYRNGRQAEALRHFAATRRLLIEELGVEPHTDLQALEHRILTHDPSLRHRPTTTPIRPSPGPQRLPMFGRNGELARLMARVQGGDAGATLLVSGEPGIGKSRLLREVADRVTAKGDRLVWVQCELGPRGAALLPIARAVSDLAQRLSGPEFQHVVGTDTLTLSPLLAPLVPVGHPSGRTEPIDVGDDLARYRMTESLRRSLRRLSELGPVLIVVDDAQWASPAMLELLAALTTEQEPWAVTFLIASRRIRMDDGAAELQALRRAPTFEAIELDGLDADAVRAMAVARFGRQGEAIAEDIRRRTGGNPLFLSELIRTLDPEDPAGSLAGLRVPVSVSEAVLARLDELSTETIDVLTVASLMGVEFEPAVCARIAGHGQGSSPTETGRTAIEWIEAALDAGLIEETSTPFARFRHELVRSAISDRLSQLRRAELHARIGRTLLDRHRSSDVGRVPTEVSSALGVLAYHLCAGAQFGTGTDGARYAARAAAHALAGHDAGEALHFCTEGLAALTHVDTGEEAADLRIELWCGRAEAHQRLAQKVEAHEAAYIAFELALEAEAFKAAVRAVAIYTGQSAGAWLAFWYPIDQALDMVERVVAAVGDLDRLDPGPAVHLLTAYSEVLFAAGRVEPSEAAAKNALVRARASGIRLLEAYATVSRLASFDATAEIDGRLSLAAGLLAEAGPHAHYGVVARRHLMVARLESDDLQGAAAEIEELEKLAIGLDSDLVAYQAALCRNSLALFRGRLRLAEDEIAAARHRFAHFDAPRLDALDIQTLWLLWETGDMALAEDVIRTRLAEYDSTASRAPLLLALLAKGQSAEARSVVDSIADAEFQRMGERPLQFMTATLLAESVIALDDRRRAGWLLDLLHPVAHRMVNFYSGTLLLGWADLPVGRLLGLLGQAAEAQHHLDRARRRAEAVGSVSFALRAAVASVEVDLRAGASPSQVPSRLIAQAEAGGYRHIADWCRRLIS
ncbi:MAG: BTAD domain-containing putative transcriptional regulator [Actinomycetota bacterium]